MALLSQILGVRKGVNTSAGKRFVEIHSAASKNQLINGHSRTYAAKDDDGEKLPSEFQRVQISVSDLIDELIKTVGRQWDVNATVDEANTLARGDIIVAGNDLALTITNIPVTTLMYLDKQLSEIASFIAKLPVLDPAFIWEYDVQAGIWKTDAIQTHRTSKVAKPIVLFPATDKHPAQTQLITEDVITGYWSATRLSGALPAPVIMVYKERVQTLREAVVKAREQANQQVVSDVTIGNTLLNFVFDS